MTRLLPLLISLCVIPRSPAQTDTPARVAWLKSNASPIRTIDPLDEDFSDLAPLKAAIGSSRIVMLGEQSHGDGSAFLAKSRLVKFLHKEMGFDVLAFESGLFDCIYVEDAFERGEPPETAWENGIFGIWSFSNEAFPALAYSTSTRGGDRPLRIAGFDSQFTSSHSKDGFMPLIDDFFGKSQPGSLPANDRAAIESVLTWVNHSGTIRPPYPPFPADACEQVRTVIAQIESEQAALLRAHDAKRIGFVTRILENLLAYARQFETMGEKGYGSINIRDRAMGESLLHLAQVEYPEKKIIVWAATFHLLRKAELLAPIDSTTPNAQSARDGLYPMGDWVWSAMGDEVYSLMFTAARGKAGICWNPAFDIGEPREDSIERALDLAGPDLMFVDLRSVRGAKDEASEWLRGEFVSRPMGYAWEKGKWCECFDGLFYTEKMERSTDRRRNGK